MKIKENVIGIFLVEKVNYQFVNELVSNMGVQANATFGTCDVPVLSPPPPSQSSPTGTREGPISGSPFTRTCRSCLFLVTLLTLLLTRI